MVWVVFHSYGALQDFLRQKVVFLRMDIRMFQFLRLPSGSSNRRVCTICLSSGRGKRLLRGHPGNTSVLLIESSVAQTESEPRQQNVYEPWCSSHGLRTRQWLMVSTPLMVHSPCLLGTVPGQTTANGMWTEKLYFPRKFWTCWSWMPARTLVHPTDSYRSPARDGVLRNICLL